MKAESRTRRPTTVEVETEEMQLSRCEWSKDQGIIMHETRVALIYLCRPSLRVYYSCPKLDLIDGIPLGWTPKWPSYSNLGMKTSLHRRPQPAYDPSFVESNLA